jgi:hypothetical protein
MEREGNESLLYPIEGTKTGSRNGQKQATILSGLFLALCRKTVLAFLPEIYFNWPKGSLFGSFCSLFLNLAHSRLYASFFPKTYSALLAPGLFLFTIFFNHLQTSQTTTMRLFSLYPILTSCSLVLALNKGNSGWRFWNTTTTQPTTIPIGPSSINNSSLFEVTATVQIQIGDLFGSGVVSFSDIPSGGLSEILTPNSNISGVPCQTDTQLTSPNTSLPYTNTTYSNRTLSPVNFNATWGHVTSRSSVALASGFPTELGLFTGSGAQINLRLPSVLAMLTAVIISLALI